MIIDLHDSRDNDDAEHKGTGFVDISKSLLTQRVFGTG